MRSIAAIVGYGETKFGKVGKDSLQLNVKAAKELKKYDDMTSIVS